MQQALFIDRDGTLVHPRHYPSQPHELRLYDEIGPGLQRLQRAGFQLIVITNQSGIAHGYFSIDDLERMHAHLARELARLQVRLDGVYYCPHHPDGRVAELAIACDCRKPQPGMLMRAATELGIDRQRSWFVGDILDDVEAGERAGCRTILVDLGTEPPPANQVREPDFVARDTAHALAIIAAVEQLGPAVELTYRPPQWERWVSLRQSDVVGFGEVKPSQDLPYPVGCWGGGAPNPPEKIWFKGELIKN
jgi:D-glycero-D-manno-heptose 1,7-bisphosphate phosphatase